MIDMNVRLMKRAVTAAVVVSAFAATGATASTCIGNCGTGQPNGDVTAPPVGGPGYGYVSTYQGVDDAGQIELAGGTNGSEFITDTFTAEAGDPLAFYFNYVTSDGTGQYIDYAFSELLAADDTHIAYLFTARTTPTGDTSPGFGLPANDSTLTPASTPITPGATAWLQLGDSTGLCFSGIGQGCGNTGWIASSYTIADAGSYKVRFGVTNFGDIAYDSGLAYAGVTIDGTPVPIGGDVPEPATWAMFIGGFGLVGSVLRKRRAPKLVRA